jgi:hypothetical protein
MPQLRNSKKAQVTLEAGVVMLYILIILTTFWLGGPVQQSTERSTDTNDLLIGAQAIDTIVSAVDMAKMGGSGERAEFLVHIPFDTVDIRYVEESSTPYIELTVLLYSNLDKPDGTGKFFDVYEVNDVGDPKWYFTNGVNKSTPFFYKTIRKELPAKIAGGSFPFCDSKARKNSTESRGAGTYLLDERGRPITFCCEAGFNIYAYAEKNNANRAEVAIRPRHYYSIAGEWKLGK